MNTAKNMNETASITIKPAPGFQVGDHLFSTVIEAQTYALGEILGGEPLDVTTSAKNIMDHAAEIIAILSMEEPKKMGRPKGSRNRRPKEPVLPGTEAALDTQKPA